MKVNYTQAELEAEHSYARAHEECGLKLHGGFSEAGEYLSPRTLHRWDAVNHWHQQLKDRDVPIVEATTSLLTEPNFPNVEQQVFLLENGVGQGFWNSLTITGLIEARGKALADLVAPDFQDIIVEDISGCSLAHMNQGLLTSHGWDEGGNPATDVGGHDTMWYATRDLAFGADKYPLPEAPASIGREKDEREMPQIPAPYEGVMSFLMNLLMIEVRAERAFDFYERVLLTETVFVDRREQANLAADLVNRIRQDESVHVAWLRAAISEFRSFTIKTVDGGEVSGAAILDPVWEKMVHWHAVEMHVQNRPANEKNLKDMVLAEANGEALWRTVEQLGAAAAAA